MKEDLPAGSFHIQEERRLFYVALTRAERKLTITTLTEKKGKVPTFIEDILMDPTVRKRDVLQISPKVKVRDTSAADAAGKRHNSLPFSIRSPAHLFANREWAESYHPPTPEPLKLSASAVDSYRKCPQLFLFSRLWSLKEGPAATLSFGSVMHTTVRRFIDQFRKGVKLPFDEVARVFETEWTSAGYEDEYQESEYKKDGIEQLRVFHAEFLANPPEVLEQEKSFELPLENNVIINGRIDQINSLGKKDVEIIDYKTGKARKEADARRDLQLSIYAIAAKEILELNPVRLAFHYLQNNQVQSTTRNDKQLDEAQKVVQEAAADIRAGRILPQARLRLPRLRLQTHLPRLRRIPRHLIRTSSNTLGPAQRELCTGAAPLRPMSARCNPHHPVAAIASQIAGFRLSANKTFTTKRSRHLLCHSNAFSRVCFTRTQQLEQNSNLSSLESTYS